MPEYRDKKALRVARIDGHVCNLLSVTQAEMRPGFTGVGRTVYSVADSEIGALQALAAADVDHIRVARRNRERAD